MKTSYWPLEHKVLSGIEPKVCRTEFGPVEYADFGTGRVVVVLHGAMGGWDQSAILGLSALGEGCRVIAVSRPGYLGTPLSSGVTPEQQADLVAALLDSLGLEKTWVTAISGGGPCALAFALRHPKRCNGLLLISTCSVPNKAKIPFRFHVMRWAARLPFLTARMKKSALMDFERTMRRSIRDEATVRRLLEEPDVMALYVALTASIFDRMAARLKGTENDIRITFSREWPLEEISVPVLVIHGTADAVVPFSLHARAFAERIRGVAFVPVEGGEHVTLFTHRKTVRAEIDRMFARETETRA